MLTTLKGRLAFWFTMICLVPLMLLTTFIYFQRVKVARELYLEKLTVIASQRQEQIVNFLDDVKGDIATIAANPIIVSATTALSQEQNNTTLRQLDVNSVATLRGYLNGHSKSGDISFVSNSGTILFSTAAQRNGTAITRPELVDKAIKERNPVFGELYHSANDQAPVLDIAIPIRSSNKTILPTVLMLHLNLTQSIFKIVENRTGFGLTGEAFLVNRDQMALNELRGRKNSALRFRLTGIPAQLAAKGQSGATESTDYRGVRVVASYTAIPQTGWGLVCQQDTQEAYAPQRNILYLTYLLAGLISLIACIFAFRLAEAISSPIKSLAQSANRIGEGDFGVRIEPTGTEEMVQLATSFNSMANTLQVRMNAQAGITQISELIMTAESLDGFFHSLLPMFMQVTGAKMAVAYMENQQQPYFIPVYAIGADVARLRNFSRNELEGELGILLSNDEIVHFKATKEQSPLRFITSFGEIVPAEIISIPIAPEGEMLAFLSLASEQRFSATSLEVIEQVRMPLCMGFERVMAGENIRRLADELTQANAELTVQSTELSQQADELSQRNIVLDQQKRQLQDATRLKSEFLSNMSHELRTPLNSVLALSRVLSAQCRERLSEDEAGYLAIIERNGRNLLALINDILDLAKIESGKLDISYETISLKAVTQEVIDGLNPLAREKGIALNFIPQETITPFISDVKKIRQILQNLIGNAVKFTHEGSVTVSLREEGNCMLVHVEDTGIGIAPEYLETIFEEFRQADGSTSRLYEGTGLGLAIVRKTARLLGGDVTVKSERHKGTAFTVSLPLNQRGKDTDNQDSMQYPVISGRLQQEPSRKCVLVVDDDPTSLSIIAAHLSQAGYDTVTALNGHDALRLAHARKPYAITLDIVMPDMDGWEVMEKLKNDPETANIPIIIVSLSDDRETGVALGAVGIVAKPVEKEILLEEFHKLSGTGCRLVLVVDDNEHDRIFIASMLKEAGLDVLMAENGEMALAMACEHHPDLITLDLVMPGMDGIMVIDRLRSTPDTSPIPVVIITSKELAAHEMAHLSSGVSAILTKGALNRTAMLDELTRTLVRVGWRLPVATSRSASRILIVEDSDAATIQLRHALESDGFTVDAVSGGKQALDYLASHIPDGIILDLMMPEIDGFAVLKAVRSSSLTAKIPVMIMTAKTLTPRDFENLKALEIRHIVQKGDVDQQELLNHVSEMLGADKLFNCDNAQLTRIATLPPKSAYGNGPILVVEDNPDNLATIKAVLGAEYHLIEAMDGEAGLEQARSQAPSLILLDMQLPRMDGMSVLQALKANPATTAIPVIALTASAMAGDMNNFLKMGCSEYISKPFEVEALKQIIRSYYKG